MDELATPASRLKPNREPQGRQSAQQDLGALLQALQAVRGGDFSVRLPTNRVGLAGKIADVFNDIVLANERMARELEQVGQTVGREGRTRRRVRLGVSAGAWVEMEGSVNALIDDLLWPTTDRKSTRLNSSHANIT